MALGASGLWRGLCQGGPGFAFVLSAGSWNPEVVSWDTQWSPVSLMQRPTARILANIFQSVYPLLGKRSVQLGCCFCFN